MKLTKTRNKYLHNMCTSVICMRLVIIFMLWKGQRDSEREREKHRGISICIAPPFHRSFFAHPSLLGDMHSLILYVFLPCLLITFLHSSSLKSWYSIKRFREQQHIWNVAAPKTHAHTQTPGSGWTSFQGNLCCGMIACININCCYSYQTLVK